MKSLLKKDDKVQVRDLRDGVVIMIGVVKAIDGNCISVKGKFTRQAFGVDDPDETEINVPMACVENVMAKYSLFLDDIREPARRSHSDIDLLGPWAVVRSYDEAVAYVEKHGFPQMVSFDHDLGEGLTGHDFAKWLCNYDCETWCGTDCKHEGMPQHFSYEVHSANPIGVENIRGYMDGYLTFRNGEVHGNS